MAKEVLLYELGDILFTAFLKAAGVTEVKTFNYCPDGRDSIQCKYALLPKKSPDSDEQPVIILIDERRCGVDNVRVVILKSLPKTERGNVVTYISEYAGVSASESSSSDLIEHNGMYGVKKWLHLKSDGPYLGVVWMSDRESAAYWFKLTDMAFDLYEDPAYAWVTLFFKSSEGITHLEVRDVVIEDKVLS